jgi:hypothetical protein
MAELRERRDDEHGLKNTENAAERQRSIEPPGAAQCYDTRRVKMSVDRPEHAVLLACAKARPDRQAVVRAAAAAPLDWPYLAAVADAHDLSPLVATNLKSSGAPVPPGVAAELDRRLVEAAAWSLSCTAQLVGVQAVLASRGIRAVAFKGPTLAVMVYSRATLRTFLDLDLLVPRRALGSVRRILAEHGYLNERNRALDGLYPPAGREDGYLPPTAGLAALEVHVAIAPWALAVQLDLDGMLARAIAIDVAGRSILTLAPEDLVLVIALHGLAHRWTFLKHVSEMDALSHLDLDWGVVADRARAARMQRILFVAMLLARDLFGTAWPADLLADAERDRHATATARERGARIFHPAPPRKINPQQWSLFLRCRERRADQLRYCTRALFAEWILKLPWDRVLRGREASGLPSP